MAFPNIIYGDYGDQRVVSTAKIGGLPLGQRMILPDGTEYRHSSAGSVAMVAAKLYEQQTYAAGTGNIKAIAVIAGSAVAGTRTMSITMSGTGAMTKDQYTDGFVFSAVSTGTGGGFAYKVKSCSSAAAGSTSVLTLYEDIHVTIAGGTTTVGLRVNPQARVELTTADTVSLGVLAGVSCASAAASSYCWLLTRGVGTAFTDNTTTIVGVAITASSTVAGAVGTVNLTAVDTGGNMVTKGNDVIGRCMSVAASAGYGLFDFFIK